MKYELIVLKYQIREYATGRRGKENCISDLEGLQLIQCLNKYRPRERERERLVDDNKSGI